MSQPANLNGLTQPMQLHDGVTEAAGDCCESTRIVEENVDAKRIFLANISHEIRTPMYGIIGMAGLMAKTSLSERQHNYLKLIQHAASSLLLSVNDVLDLENIVCGQLKLERAPFKIVDKISATFQSFIYLAEEKGLAVVFQNTIPGDLIVVGDACRLTQVLNNILGNALKFTSSGSIVINTRVLQISGETAVFECSIKDTGIGMSSKILSRVYEPFFQADPGIQRKYGGKGLGLSICKKLIQLQEGTIAIQSEENIGTAANFRIPFSISQEINPPLHFPLEINYLTLGKKKVLVAEEEGLNHHFTKHIMESWGFEVTSVIGGKQAVSILQREAFDLLLIDVQMTEMDGITATRSIRQMKNGKAASIPIIGLTNYGLKDDTGLFIEAGMSDYLPRPFSEARLFEVVARNLINDKTNSINMERNEANESEPTSFPKLYDLSMIIEVSGGDEEFVKKMVALFIETVPVNLNELNAALDSENWDMVSKMAHKLKSTIDSMGIHSLNQDVRTVEHTAKKKEALENIPGLVHNMNIIIGECVRQLDAEVMQQAHS